MNNFPTIFELNENKRSGYSYRRRRHSEWTENYTLYRDKVQLNRLTQRQSVNIPLIKTIIKTLLKDIDNPPLLYFSSIDNDDQAEVFYNEHYKFTSEDAKIILKDIVDKRQVLLFGRSFKHLNIVNGRVHVEIKDPQDIGIDRYVDPADIDSARFLYIEHNYQPLSSLTTNMRWDRSAIRRLQEYLSSDEGLHHSSENMLDFVEKQARMANMGLIDAMNPILGESYLELIEHFTKRFNKFRGEDEIIYSVVAEDRETLFQAPLEEVIGMTSDNFWRNHYPLNTWGDETERTDFWSDSVTDTLRPLNKVMNAWWSQEVENRTLRNFGMNYYNSSLSEDGFDPQSYTPEPAGWYPVPAGEKKLGDQFMHVDIPNLEDTLEDMNFLQQVAQQASAATAFQQGEAEQKEMTLGEVKILYQSAQERIKSMQVYYVDSWKDFGNKYIKLIEAASHHLDPVTIHRHGRLTKKMYSRVITPVEDLKTKSGFHCEVRMKEEKQQQDMNAMQWMNAARSLMPMNPIVDEEYKKKLLENGDFPDEKIMEALKIDRQQTEAMRTAQAGQLPQVEAPKQAINYKDASGDPSPVQQQMLKEVGIQSGAEQQPQAALPSGQAQAQPQQQARSLPTIQQALQMSGHHIAQQ